MSLTPNSHKRTAPVRHELPTAPLPRNLCGPETITGLVRACNGVHTRLWDDPLNRIHYCDDAVREAVERADEQQQVITVTTEKLRGRWQITKVELAKP